MERSPLQVACKFGHLDICRLLLSKGADVDHVGLEGFSAIISLWFMRSLSFSREDFLKAMLSYSPLPIRPRHSEFWNPAFQVAIQGCKSDMELLVRLGADIHDIDASGSNIMKYCIVGSNLETFDYLVDRIPCEWIHRRDHQGRNALHHVFSIPSPFAAEMGEWQYSRLKDLIEKRTTRQRRTCWDIKIPGKDTGHRHADLTHPGPISDRSTSISRQVSSLSGCICAFRRSPRIKSIVPGHCDSSLEIFSCPYPSVQLPHSIAVLPYQGGHDQ